MWEGRGGIGSGWRPQQTASQGQEKGPNSWRSRCLNVDVRGRTRCGGRDHTSICSACMHVHDRILASCHARGPYTPGRATAGHASW